MTLTYLFSADMTTPTKIVLFSLFLVDLWENCLRYRNGPNFNEQLLGKWVGLSNDTNINPNLIPSPHLGGQNMKHIANIRILTFKWNTSAVKFLGSTNSSGKVVCATIMNIYAFYDFGETPTTDAINAFCSNRCFFETAASICIHTLCKRVLHGLNQCEC